MEKDKEYWIFTFGEGHAHPGYYVKIYGTYGEARVKMVNKYGIRWAFQHSAKEWEEWEKERPWYMPIEKELEVIE